MEAVELVPAPTPPTNEEPFPPAVAAELAPNAELLLLLAFMMAAFAALLPVELLTLMALPPAPPPACVRPTAAKAAAVELDDCPPFDAFDFRCLLDETAEDEADDELVLAPKLVVILMLVADVDEAVAFIVESISFSDDDPESDESS